MNSFIFKFFVLLLLGVSYSNALVLRDDPSQNLLEQSKVYFDQEFRSFEAIKQELFVPYHQQHINRSFDAKTVIWIYLELENKLDEDVNKIIEVDNPLLESVRLYEGKTKKVRGMLHVRKEQHSINPAFILHFHALEKKVLWIAVENRTTALQFSLVLKSVDIFEHDDHLKQYTITMFLGIIFAFFTYAFILFIYTKDISYLFYTFYLVTLIFQQMTYVGFLPLHAPLWFSTLDSMLVVPKVGIMIIAAIWFAQSFLKTIAFKKLHRFYNVLVWFLVIQMPLVGTPWFYYPEVTVLTGLVFIVFNTYVGIYVYLNGNKQARFFIAGWLILILAYLIMIFDALGVISVMYQFPNLLMWATALEALFLLLAFVDKLNILQQEKNQLDAQLLCELHSRNAIVQEQVETQTHDLNVVLQEKKALLKELHHRVKNNLQLILSLIRLQSNSLPCEEKERYFLDLENRIKAISKTHENLYLNDNVDTIDMQEYIETLVHEIHMGYALQNVTMQVDAVALMPIREAVYVGLVVNELVTNSMKYAFEKGAGSIKISFNQQEKNYLLVYEDSGKGYEGDAKVQNSVGLDLVASLVQVQLSGTYEVVHKGHLKYTIGFSL